MTERDRISLALLALRGGVFLGFSDCTWWIAATAPRVPPIRSYIPFNSPVASTGAGDQSS